MLCDYDKSKAAQMERDARNKQELEYYTRINAATKEGREKGMAEGLEKGMAQGLEKGLAEGLEKGKEEGRKVGEKAAEAKMIKTMFESGMSKEDISRVLKMDLSYIEEILK